MTGLTDPLQIVRVIRSTLYFGADVIRLGRGGTVADLTNWVAPEDHLAVAPPT